jgi:hypothetical protein
MEVKIEAPLPERIRLKSEGCPGQREELLRSMKFPNSSVV